MDVIVDTNIYLDYLFKRRNWKFAKKFFIDTISCKHKILLPKTIVDELDSQNATNDIELQILLNLRKKKKVFFIANEKTIVSNAKKLSIQRQLPFVDCLIALIAKEKQCIILSRDKHIYLNLADLADCFKPEDLV
jgi:predicted nucleic acid-binding protein